MAQEKQPKNINLKEAGLTGHNRQRRKKELDQEAALRKLVFPWFTHIKR